MLIPTEKVGRDYNSYLEKNRTNLAGFLLYVHSDNVFKRQKLKEKKTGLHRLDYIKDNLHNQRGGFMVQDDGGGRCLTGGA